MRIRIVLAISAAALALSACGSTEEPTTKESSPAISTPTEASYDGPTIPDGTYEKLLSPKEAAALIGEDRARELWPKSGSLHQVYKFAGTSWTELNADGEAPLQKGSDGTLSYDEAGRLVLHEPCCGDTAITWTVDGDTLTMKTEGGDDPMDRVMRDGTYTKQP
jgi:hypothetical protein